MECAAVRHSERPSCQQSRAERPYAEGQTRTWCGSTFTTGAGCDLLSSPCHRDSASLATLPATFGTFINTLLTPKLTTIIKNKVVPAVRPNGCGAAVKSRQIERACAAIAPYPGVSLHDCQGFAEHTISDLHD
jgi:hypothetical protein